MTYATAYAGLVRYGGLRKGETVLIQAAAGGVGIAATHMAKLVGAEVYGTASPAKHDAIRGFGVDHPIDYRTHDVVDEVRRVSGRSRPIDVAFDAIGGRSFKQSFSLLEHRRAAGVLRRLRGAGRGAAQPAARSTRTRADASLQSGQADGRVAVGDRAQHAQAVGRQEARSTTTSSHCGPGSTRAESVRWWPASSGSTTARSPPLRSRAQERGQGRADPLTRLDRRLLALLVAAPAAGAAAVTG